MHVNEPNEDLIKFYKYMCEFYFPSYKGFLKSHSFNCLYRVTNHLHNDLT